MKKPILIFGLIGIVCGLLLLFLGGASQNASSAFIGILILGVSLLSMIIRHVFGK